MFKKIKLHHAFLFNINFSNLNIKTLSSSCSSVSRLIFSKNIFLIEILQLFCENIKQINYKINHKIQLIQTLKKSIRLKISVWKCVERNDVKIIHLYVLIKENMYILRKILNKSTWDDILQLHLILYILL